MRIPQVLLVAVLGLPLCGCLGVTLPPAPIPDWAMNPQVQANERAGQSPARKKHRVVHRTKPTDLTAVDSALVTGGMAADAQSTPRVVETRPFAPGWNAREDERDESLRRTLNICRGC